MWEGLSIRFVHNRINYENDEARIAHGFMSCFERWVWCGVPGATARSLGKNPAVAGAATSQTGFGRFGSLLYKLTSGRNPPTVASLNTATVHVVVAAKVKQNLALAVPVRPHKLSNLVACVHQAFTARALRRHGESDVLSETVPWTSSASVPQRSTTVIAGPQIEADGYGA